jgi:Heparinase II/III-like protein
LPFDSARSLQRETAEGPDFARAEAALAQFTARHPYLLFHRGSLSGIRCSTAANPHLQARAAQVLSEVPAPVAQEPRTALKRRARRLINIAFIALTAEGSAADAALAATRSALAEFAAAASWNERPVIRSFLDRGEIAVAVALAYDWLYDKLAPRERRAIEQAILHNVLEPASAAYADPSLLWPKRRDNCTLVSNSAITIAALAVLHRHRALSASLVCQSLASAWNVFGGLAPDGGWREGLSYWSLAMRYAGLMVAALESALDNSFGLADRPGFAQTGDLVLHAVGPFGAAFNFGDSEHRFDVSPLAWLACRFGRPIDGWLLGDPDGWHLLFTAIWPRPAKACPMTLGLPTGKIFHSADLACFRNTWSGEPTARPVYLAVKGGNISAQVGAAPRPEDLMLHAQADAGTFILDGARHRWVTDLGSDDYDLPGYFDHGSDTRSGLRWQYYRSQAAGHNTLTIGRRDQVPNAPARIVGSCVEGDCKWVVVDLSAAYDKPSGTVRRGAALIGRQVVIQDEVDPDSCIDVVWAIHTSAEPVALAGSLARFRMGNDRFVARILEPAGARFELVPPPPPRSFACGPAHEQHGRPMGDGALVSELPRREDQAGERAAGAPIQRLQIAWPAGTRRLTVLLLPDCDGTELALPVAPLDHWLARRPVRLTGLPRRGCRTRAAHAAGRGSPVRHAISKLPYARQDSEPSRGHG